MDAPTFFAAQEAAGRCWSPSSYASVVAAGRWNWQPLEAVLEAVLEAARQEALAPPQEAVASRLEAARQDPSEALTSA